MTMVFNLTGLALTVSLESTVGVTMGDFLYELLFFLLFIRNQAPLSLVQVHTSTSTESPHTQAVPLRWIMVLQSVE